MINVLVIDDDANKVEQIRQTLLEALPSDQFEIATAGNIFDGASMLASATFDLLILDIQIPQRRGENPEPQAGVRFLRQLYSSKKYNIPDYIVGLTAFDDKLEEFRKEFSDRMWHLLKYDVTFGEWADKITGLFLHIADARDRRGKTFHCDLAIITALEDVELEAVLNLSAGWKVQEVAGDATIYHRGAFTRGTTSISVVAAAALEMGMSASTALAMKIISHFRPRFLAMVGIAAGVEGQHGDILIADVAFDYGSGKLKAKENEERKFSPDPHPIPMEHLLKAKLSLFKRQASTIDSIRQRAAGRAVPDRLNVRMGPVGSGAAVIQDRAVIEEVQTLWRKLVGVEMETYGVFVAARYATEPRPLVMSIKSVCDFADATKADDYQRYAAYTSANFLYEFSLDQLHPPVSQS